MPVRPARRPLAARPCVAAGASAPATSRSSVATGWAIAAVSAPGRAWPPACGRLRSGSVAT